MSVIVKDVAEATINKWLDTKKVFKTTRETNADSINLLIEAVMEGCLTHNESDNSLTHVLLHPQQSEQPVTSLTYKGRLNDNMLQKYLKGVASNDGDARLNAIIAALTDQPRGVINALDSIDKKISMAIAVFFI